MQGPEWGTTPIGQGPAGQATAANERNLQGPGPHHRSRQAAELRSITNGSLLFDILAVPSTANSVEKNMDVATSIRPAPGRTLDEGSRW